MNFLKKFFRHPWAIIIICLACTGFFGYFIKNLQMDNSLRQFFPQKDESYDRMNATEDTFGSMLSIGIVLDAENGTILTPEYLGVIKRISETGKGVKIVRINAVDEHMNGDGSISQIAEMVKESLPEKIIEEEK